MELRNKLSWAITSRRLNDNSFSPPRIPYILPDASFMVWNDNPSRGQEFLKILFGVPHMNVCYPAQMRCPSDTPFEELVTKIQRKLVQIRYPYLEREMDFDPTEYANVDVIVEKRSPCSTLERMLDANKTIQIGGFEYRVIKNALDTASSVPSVLLYPIVDCPLVPPISLTKNDQSLKSSSTIHWFVGPPNFIPEDLSKQKKPKFRGYALSFPMDINFEDVKQRTFQVEGFSFRGTGPYFVPSKNDVAQQIVFIVDLGPDSVVRCGVIGDIVQDQVEKPIYEQRIEWAAEERKGIRLATYNILADLYLGLKPTTTELFFPYCPMLYQKPDYRYALLLQEIKSYDADIFFMQEVDEKFEKRYLTTMLDSLGMNFVFERKRRVKQNSFVGEGTGIAYKRSLFREVERFSTCIANLLEENPDIKDILQTSAASTEVFLTRPTTLQIVVLQNLVSSDYIVCATTHLYFNPAHEHIKAVQAVLAVRKIYEFADKFDKVRVVFAGDFNSLPDGPVHKLLQNGFLSAQDECWSYDKEIKTDGVKLLLNRDSSPLVDLIQTKDYTNYTQFTNQNGEDHGFSGVLDYIWTDGFKLERTAPTVPHDLVTKYQAIPSKIAPSDHIPIIAEFEPADRYL